MIKSFISVSSANERIFDNGKEPFGLQCPPVTDHHLSILFQTFGGCIGSLSI